MIIAIVHGGCPEKRINSAIKVYDQFKHNFQEKRMVMIDPNKTILNVPQGRSSGNRSNVKKGEFDSIFRKVADSATIKDAAAEATPSLSDVRPARFVTEPLSPTNMVVAQVKQLIDTMEVYQQKLMENGTTLKDIQTQVQKMASESESLSAVAASETEQESLKTIIDQSLMLSSMEIAKFNSGYYNDG
jgi:hypothetical protein